MAGFLDDQPQFPDTVDQDSVLDRDVRLQDAQLAVEPARQHQGVRADRQGYRRASVELVDDRGEIAFDILALEGALRRQFVLLDRESRSRTAKLTTRSWGARSALATVTMRPK